MKRILTVTLCVLSIRAFSLDLTLESARSLALSHNSRLRIEQLKLENYQSVATNRRSDYIPILKIDSFISEKENLPLTDDEKTQSISLTQKLPAGGELAIKETYLDETYTGKYYKTSSITYTHPLLKGGMSGPLFENLDKARYDILIQERGLEKEKVDLILKVETSYFETLYYQRRVAYSKENIAVLDKVLNLVRGYLKKGIVPERELIYSEIEKSKAETTLLTDLANLEGSRMGLQSLLALSEPVTVREDFPEDYKIPDIEDSVSFAIKNSVAIKWYKEKVAKQRFLAELAGEDLLPSLDLFMSYTRSGTGLSRIDANELDGKESKIGLTFTYPLYNRGLQEKHRQKLLSLEQLNVTLTHETEKLARGVTSTIKQLRILNKSLQKFKFHLSQYRQLLSFSLDGMKKGLIGPREVYQSQEDYLESKLSYLKLQINFLKKRTFLEAYLGYPSQTENRE